MKEEKFDRRTAREGGKSWPRDISTYSSWTEEKSFDVAIYNNDYLGGKVEVFIVTLKDTDRWKLKTSWKKGNFETFFQKKMLLPG